MIYQYRCENCKREQEVSRSVDDRNLPMACAHCEAPMRRIPVAHILIPSHFQAHTHTTGLRDELGSAPDMGRRRWNRPGGL